MTAEALQAALDALTQASTAHQPPPVAVWSRTLLQGSAPGVALRAMPTDPEQAAQVLFAQLREFDDAGAAEIWVERVPETAAWAGVADRLRRAAA